MTLQLYDTARRDIVPFAPGHVVRMYTCGITPYDAAHVGFVSTVVTYDVLQRRLRDSGHETRCVRNITDVDDSILEKARSLGVHYLDLALAETKGVRTTLEALSILPVFSEPRATSAIGEVRRLISDVLDRGHAYESGGAVYFDVKSFPSFGQVSHLSDEEMLRIAADQGGHVDDSRKRHPLDFVLWQPSSEDEPSWESRWGPGRPGWHIECSALALRELGPTVDLHGGGIDLVFPHHECEAAQSEASTGRRPFVRHWMHHAMVRMGGKKMSKSVGNLVFVDDLLEQWEPAVVRAALISRHYRQPWEWDASLLDDAAERVERWRSAGPGDAGIDGVRDALDRDLDTPAALAVLDDEADARRGVLSGSRLLGIDA